jgi:xyloglucan-specific exo-beta-1,4-glucanase
VVRVGHPNSRPRFDISHDGGATCKPSATQPDGISAGGRIAINADGTRAVWSPNGTAVVFSADDGATWAPSEGLPTGAGVESDRVNSAVFYTFCGGMFYLHGTSTGPEPKQPTTA